MNDFDINIGFYPGVLLGIRIYEAEDASTYVLYTPFISLALVSYHDDEL
jgi:hypothetical protein